MRKVFWCGAVAAVCLAAFVYLAADYSRNHSDTLLGRCASTAYQVATKYNPIYRLSQVAAQGAFRTAKDMLAPMQSSEAGKGGEEACEGAGAKAAGHCPRDGKVVNAQGDEVKDMPAGACLLPVPAPVVNDAANELGKIIIQEVEEHPAEKPMVLGEGKPAEIPQFMPYVDDHPPVPATMPRVEEDRLVPAADVKSAGPDGDAKSPIPAEMPKVDQQEDEHEALPYHENPHSNCCPYSGKCPDDDEQVPFQPKVTEPSKDSAPPQVTEQKKDEPPVASPEPESKAKSEKSDKSKKKCDKIGEGCPSDSRPHFDCIPF
jgi:hypothetical protein